MATTLSPSESYSITMRLEIQNKVGMLGKVTTAIGTAGGDIGAVDLKTLGPAIRFHEVFGPAGTNVNWVQAAGPDRLGVTLFHAGARSGGSQLPARRKSREA